MWLMFKIRVLLDLSWDELRMAICSLRPLIGDHEKQPIMNVSMVVLDLTSYLPRLLWDLAYSSLRVLLRRLHGEVAVMIM
jgi:hypothetical protein